MMNRVSALSTLALMALAGTAYAQCDTAKLTPAIPGPDDWFGSSMAMKNGVLVVGNPYADVGANAEQGSLRVFYNILGWTAQATLSHTNGQAGDWFGRAVDISGDWIIAGSPMRDSASGSVAFFERSGSQWIMRTSLGQPSPQASSYAGNSVAIDGDHAIWGIPNRSTGDASIGWADIGTRLGNTWTRSGTFYINPSAPLDNAGASVGVRGDRFMMGVPGRSISGHPGAGAIAVAIPTVNIFQQDQLMAATDPQDGAALGRSAALGDNIIIAGAPDYDDGITVDSGAVYIFEPGQFGIWVQTGKIVPPSPTPGAHFGGRVALDGNRIAISEYGTGKTYIYRKTNLGGWVEEWRLHDPETLGQGFGAAVAVSGNQVAVSSILGEVNGVNAAGYVNVFDMTGAFGANAKAFAQAVSAGSYSGCTEFATDDGSASCGNSNTSPDVWFRFIAPCTGNVTFNTFGSNFDTVLSIHASSISGPGASIACNDNAGQFFETSSATTLLTSGQEVYIRIGGNSSAHGNYTLTIQACGPSSCYANCDASTSAPLLTANDFQCFLNKFAAADAYANCDHSTSNPLLTANDFQCFLNAYAAGCT